MDVVFNGMTLNIRTMNMTFNWRLMGTTFKLKTIIGDTLYKLLETKRPNDIHRLNARWSGSSYPHYKAFRAGEDFRPIKLQIAVLGARQLLPRTRRRYRSQLSASLSSAGTHSFSRKG